MSDLSTVKFKDGLSGATAQWQTVLLITQIKNIGIAEHMTHSHRSGTRLPRSLEHSHICSRQSGQRMLLHSHTNETCSCLCLKIHSNTQACISRQTTYKAFIEDASYSPESN